MLSSDDETKIPTATRTEVLGRAKLWSHFCHLGKRVVCPSLSGLYLLFSCSHVALTSFRIISELRVALI